MTDTPNAPAEFASDEHRKNHMAALVRERKGYEQKAAGLEQGGDTAAAENAKSRAAQVASELTRIADSAKRRGGATR